jgi:methylenetetrahydrofolate reductase (NADPH)
MSAATPNTSEQIRSLLKNASVEMTCKDTGDLAEVATLVPPGTDIFIALFPNQTWDDLTMAAKAVREAGLNPVPHVPARRIKNRAEVAEIAQKLTKIAGCTKMLLIAGDMPAPEGEYDSTIGVLETGEFAAAGIKAICMAGHPEGHAHMTVEQQRFYEARKVELATQQGFELTLMTQVCFESEPMVVWEKLLRANGITVPVRAGIAGPASIKTLLRFAKICGAGASMRALTSGKAGLIGALLTDNGPEEVVTQLSQSQGSGASHFQTVHLFAFGGFLKTCKWLSAVQKGNFKMSSKDDDFTVSL